MKTTKPRSQRNWRLGIISASVVSLLGVARWTLAEDATAVEGRLTEAIKYLASDDLEGRGVGTEGLNKAAEFIQQQYKDAGLKVDSYDGTAFQKFKLTTGARLGNSNRLSFLPPPSDGKQAEPITLKVGENYNPLTFGGSSKFDLPLVFVGYGITAKAEKYDDYAGVDVKDKAVIVMRHEPQQDNPHSVFNGTETSSYAPYVRKISNAFEHGAAAIIFINDEFELQRTLTTARTRWQAAVDKLAKLNADFKAVEKPNQAAWLEHQDAITTQVAEVQRLAEILARPRDAVIAVNAGGADSGGRDLPVIFAQRASIDPIVKQVIGKTLAEIETLIDKDLAPRSAELTGWRVDGQTSISRTDSEVKNVVGVLEGEGPHANETIVFGAHYDHLGYGGQGSMAQGSRAIHNGADDNGSGTTALMEVARQIAAKGKPKHRMVFIAFTGEERGLIGSARYVREPLFPIESTIAMINMDMVGRLTDEKLTVLGVGTAKGFDALVDKYTDGAGFKITKDPLGPGNSDHASFYAGKVPVLFFFTNTHRDYHRPTDDWEKINISGMRRIVDLVVSIATDIDNADARPQFTEVRRGAAASGRGAPGGDAERPYFGSIPDFSQDKPGYILMGVSADGPAEKAGLKAGDVIIQLGESRIGNLEDFDSALRKFTTGDKVPVTLKRGDEGIKLEVKLEAPR